MCRIPTTFAAPWVPYCITIVLVADLPRVLTATPTPLRGHGASRRHPTRYPDRGVVPSIGDRLLPDLPIINRGGTKVLARRKSYNLKDILDDGEWLRPYFSSMQTKAQLVPDRETVARIREQVFNLIAEESISLVA